MRDPDQPPFWQWIKDYLSFHHQDRKNITVLVAFIFMLLAAQLFLNITAPENNLGAVQFLGPEHFTKLQASIDSTESVKEQERRSKWTNRDDRPKWNPRQFDPNELDSAGWRTIGLSPKQAAVMVRIKEERGGFKSKRELENLRMISFIYPKIEPYVLLPESVEYEPKQYAKRKDTVYPQTQFEKITVELNSADSVELTRLYGIGPSFAKRIIKYRASLGGFIAKEQLMEVYGMDSARYLRLEKEILVDPFLITPININTANIDALKKHPYIRYNMAKAIVNYRNQHGHFTSVSQLSKIHLINSETLAKLQPYLTAE